MATIEIRGAVDLSRTIRELGVNIPQIRQRTLTAIAFNARDEMRLEMARVFDRPTRYTLNSMFVTRATATESSKLSVKNEFGADATRFLGPQISGGQRRFKRFEGWLGARGILPNGFQTVPGRFARYDRSGNMSAGQITEILSDLGATPDPMQAGRRNRYFVVQPRNGQVGGIYKRTANDLVPVLLFVRRATYRARLDFFVVGQRVFERDYATEFEAFLNRALR